MHMVVGERKKGIISLVVIISILLLIIANGFYRLYLRQKASSMNVVIISIDTLRPDHMSLYGYQKDTTPYIDAWAKDALVFTNARTVLPMTYPSFTALMTGSDLLKLRILSNGSPLVSDNANTLASVLKENGYKTAAFTTGALSARRTNLAQGFDMNSFLTYKYYYFEGKRELNFQSDQIEYEQFLDTSVDWLNKNSDKKFFLWVHLMDPHQPYQPPAGFACKFATKKVCDTIKTTSAQQREIKRSYTQFCQSKPPPKDEVEMNEALYDGGIAYSDFLAGKILDVLKQKGLDNNTLVMIYGDHGEGFDHNYYYNHRDVLYESAVRIPVIIKYPLSFAKGNTDRFIMNYDIGATILDLLHISSTNFGDMSESFSSSFYHDFFSLFSSQEKRTKGYFMNSTLSKYAMFDGRYKYIYSLPQSCQLQGKNEELYDIQTDKDELKDIHTTDKDITKKLRDDLLQNLSLYNLPPKSQKDFNYINDKNSYNLGEKNEDVIENLKSLRY